MLKIRVILGSTRPGRNGEAVGSCRWSDVAVFSFHPVKIVTTAEGGMALTNDGEVADRMRMLRTHGITREPARMQQAGGPPAAWHYEQQMLGFNYRLTDLHAALGTSQLDRLEEYVQRRNMLAERYDRLLAELPLQRPFVQSGNRSAFHLYVVRLAGEGAEARRRRVFDGLRARGIGVNVHYTPVHLQPYYRALGFREGLCPEAEVHGATAITLPLYPRLSDQEQDRVVEALDELLAS